MPQKFCKPICFICCCVWVIVLLQECDTGCFCADFGVHSLSRTQTNAWANVYGLFGFLIRTEATKSFVGYKKNAITMNLIVTTTLEPTSNMQKCYNSKCFKLYQTPYNTQKI